MMSRNKWTTTLVTAVVVYILGSGPMHGLYYAEVLPDGVADWIEYRIYAPMNWLELRDPTDSIHQYKYWWYLKMQHWLVPPHVDPGSKPATATGTGP